MADEAVIKVRLDTDEAKANLKELAKDAEGISGTIGGNIRGRVGLGIGAVTGLVGGLVGGGILGRVLSGVTGGATELVGNTLSRLATLLERAAFDDLPLEARGKAIAQRRLIGDLGPIGGLIGKLPEGAGAILDIYEREEIAKLKTARMVEEQFPLPGAKELAEKVAEGTESGIMQAWETIKLWFEGWNTGGR